MQVNTISFKLFNTLQEGRKKLGEEALNRVRQFVVSAMTGHDTFRNKSGQEDIYYTLFGLMLAYVLGIRIESAQVEKYLDDQEPETMDLIHYAAYVRCRILLPLLKLGRVGLLIHALKSSIVRPLEEFQNIPHGDPTSPYTRFIWLSLQEDAGQRVKDKDSLLASLKEYRVADGGYANRPGSGTATVNATAAALSVAGQLQGYKINRDVEALREMQDSSGGYKATALTPAPDLLSTATALFTLRCYGVEPKVSPVDFVEAHWLDSGGFAATLLDEESDVEYTFYGLLALGACS